MILPERHAKLIQRGKKTTHRVKVQQGRRLPQIGDSLPVQVQQGDKRRTLFNIEILDRFRADAREITDAEAVQEGHADRGAFFAWYRETYEGVEPPASTEPLGHPAPVMVLRIQPDDRKWPTDRHQTTNQDEASDAARGHVHHPTTVDHLQEVPDDWLRERIKESRNVESILKAEEEDRREARRLTARIRDLKARARRDDVDTTPQIRQIEKALDELEQAIKRRAA